MYSSGGKCLWMSCVVSFFSAMGLYRFIVHSWLSQKQQPEYFGLAELLNFWMFDSCWIHALVVWYVLSIDFSCNSPHKDVRIVEGMWKDDMLKKEVKMEGKRGLNDWWIRKWKWKENGDWWRAFCGALLPRFHHSPYIFACLQDGNTGILSAAFNTAVHYKRGLLRGYLGIPSKWAPFADFPWSP